MERGLLLAVWILLSAAKDTTAPAPHNAYAFSPPCVPACTPTVLSCSLLYGQSQKQSRGPGIGPRWPWAGRERSAGVTDSLLHMRAVEGWQGETRESEFVLRRGTSEDLQALTDLSVQVNLYAQDNTTSVHLGNAVHTQKAKISRCSCRYTFPQCSPCANTMQAFEPEFVEGLIDSIQTAFGLSNYRSAVEAGMFVWIYTCLRRNSRGNETWGDCGYLIDLVHYMQTQIKADWGLSIKHACHYE